MFPMLPEEIERIIWNKYWKININKEIETKKSIWLNPSVDLLYNSSDIGALQHGFSDLERTLFSTDSCWPDFKLEIYNTCFENICHECLEKGFPCKNAVSFGNLNKNMNNKWDIKFYKSKLVPFEAYEFEADYI